MQNKCYVGCTVICYRRKRHAQAAAQGTACMNRLAQVLTPWPFEMGKVCNDPERLTGPDRLTG